jgi:hypothetical protein
MALLAVASLLAARAASAAEPGESLTISLLTMGPGEHPFTKFGHTAIWVHDAQTGRDEVYNFGTFAFDSPTLLLDSIQGKLPYWLSVQSLRGTLRSYGEAQRSLLASELELTPPERELLYANLQTNERPENRFYRYDYYRDNCATRVRDAIDHVLGGRIFAASQTAARMTFRAHTLRLVADDAPLYAALDLAVGRRTDAPITFWDEGFLPARLRDLMLNTTVLHGGQKLPLVRNEQLLLPASLPLPRAQPPEWLGLYLRAGMAVGALLAALGLVAHYKAALRTALGVAFTVLGLVFGLLGCALCYLTFISLHSAAAADYNVLLVPPWLLFFVGLAPSMVRGKPWAWVLARWLTGSALLCVVGAICVHAVQRYPQQNWQEICFALPLWLGAAAAAQLASTKLVRS